MAPLILLHQWAREINDKVASPMGRNVLIHHGTDRVKRAAQIAAYDFVITTYDVLRSEHAAASRSSGSNGEQQQQRWRWWWW